MKSKVKNQYSLTDKVLELAGIVTSLVITIVPYLYYAELPDEIPNHFNFKGLPDAWGHKSSIWALPVIAVVLYIGLSVMNYFLFIKQDVNPMVTDDNKILKQVLHLMQYLKLALNLGFLYIVIATIQVAFGKADGLGVWFLPVFIILMTVLPLFFVIKIAASSAVGKRK